MKANRLLPVIKSKQKSPARSSTTRSRSTASVSGQYINTGFEDMQIEIPTEATTTAATAAPGFVPQMSPEEWAAMQKVIKMFGQSTL
ncbi:unnamed protein product [Cylindrotheca closterium]|nr:unnamed protein product [Cylindrotheca closterium]